MEPSASASEQHIRAQRENNHCSSSLPLQVSKNDSNAKISFDGHEPSQGFLSKDSAKVRRPDSEASRLRGRLDGRCRPKQILFVSERQVYIYSLKVGAQILFAGGCHSWPIWHCGLE